MTRTTSPCPILLLEMKTIECQQYEDLFSVFPPSLEVEISVRQRGRSNMKNMSARMLSVEEL